MISRFFPLFLAIAAFAITLAVENWPSVKSEGPVHASATAQSTAHLQAHDPPQATKSFVSSLADSVVPNRSQQSTGRSGPPREQAEAGATQSDPLQMGPDPSELRAPALIQLETTAEAGQIATFTNTGPRRMTFTISTVDSTGAIHSSIQVTAPPHKREVLNDKGLIILPGDQVVVRSPPYQDFSVTAD